MSKRLVTAALAAAVGAVIVVSPAIASETGMASIHTWRKVGKKTCFIDHFHDGSGTGPNRGKAEAAAIGNWAGFTDLEYGSSWANFRNAEQKQMNCSQSSSGWTCDVSAIPCRGN